jgi:uncharacterized protein HemX
MEQSPVELISRQRQRVDALAQAARRFFNDAASEALRQLSTRLTRVAATLAAPAGRRAGGRSHLESHLENLVRSVSLLRVDELSGITRVAWVLAEIEESLHTPAAGLMPVYTAN